MTTSHHQSTSVMLRSAVVQARYYLSALAQRQHRAYTVVAGWNFILSSRTLAPPRNTISDVFVNNAMFPGIVRFGGNTGTVNSFAGVDITDLTGGAFNLASLAEGNNAACFFLQASQQGVPDAADPALGAIGSVANWVAQQIAPINDRLGCPQLASFNSALFDQFPGASYKAEGQSGKKGLLGGILG